ncbi:MAG: hypothetical protein HC884_05995 [Chloroflexaceae bacterium]|nr:hypothetical protein [Chloroflexaceae bacterium]
MTAQIGWCKVAREQFAAALTTVWGQLGTDGVSAWLEDPLRGDGFGLRDGDVTLDEAQQWLVAWPQGRLFGAAGEVQWVCRDDDDGRVHLVLTSDHGVPAGSAYAATALDLETVGDEEMFLWGRYRGQAWREDRLSELRYPPAWRGPYATLQTRIYEHLAGEQRPYDRRIVRYVGYDGNHRGEMKGGGIP